jgi:hypothetical protein
MMMDRMLGLMLPLPSPQRMLLVPEEGSKQVTEVKGNCKAKFNL